MMSFLRFSAPASVLLLMSFVISIPVQAASLSPATPQPVHADLRAGLSVIYYMNAFRHVDEIKEWAEYKKGEQAIPILKLDYRVGTGKVLTSDNINGVGAHIRGYIFLEEAGTYAFAAQSNDGLRLHIGGQMVVNDPDVHADRYSDPVEVEVAAPGWYVLEALYFERKNTSTLQLFWLRPEDEEGSMSIVPAEFYAHKKP